MADTALADPGPPAVPPADWRDALASGTRGLWEVHKRHPWLAQLGPLTRPLTVPHLLAYSERMLAGLVGHGLDAAAMLDLTALLYGYVLGLAANLERETQAADASGLSAEQFLEGETRALEAVVASGTYPTFTAVFGTLRATGYDLDLDALFELGMGFLLDGLARRLDAP